jgi:hypothetical protein
MDGGETGIAMELGGSGKPLSAVIGADGLPVETAIQATRYNRRVGPRPSAACALDLKGANVIVTRGPRQCWISAWQAG